MPADWCGNTMIQFTGRTYAQPCGSHGTELFFTNDEGTYLVQMRDKLPTQMQEFESRTTGRRSSRRSARTPSRSSTAGWTIPMITPITLPFNQWNVNKPGTTLFMPVTDVTWEYINLLMLLMDAPNRFYIYDDMNGNAEPLKKFADRGTWTEPRRRALRAGAGMRLATTGVEQAMMEQNMYLARRRWVWAAGSQRVRRPCMGMPLMGFRFRGQRRRARSAARPVGGTAGVVGLDGLFESYCPPYYRIWRRRAGDLRREVGLRRHLPGGLGRRRYRDRQALDLRSQDDGVVRGGDEGAVQYIWETYGRFPVPQTRWR